MSVATTRACGRSAASVTARQPLPVPTSMTVDARVGQDPQRFLDDQLGIGTRHQGVAGHREVAAPELAGAGDHRDRLAPRPSIDEGLITLVEAGGRGVAVVRQQLRAVPAEDVPGEHLGVDRGGIGSDPRRLELPPRGGDALVQGHPGGRRRLRERRDRWDQWVASPSLDSFSFCDWS